MFEQREWLMQGRGDYTYDDDRYKMEVKYLMDEFEKLKSDTWANIKSKSVDYRRKVIANFLAEQRNGIDRMQKLRNDLFYSEWRTLDKRYTNIAVIECPVGVGVIYIITEFLRHNEVVAFNTIKDACYTARHTGLAWFDAALGERGNAKYVLIDDFQGASIELQDALLGYASGTGLKSKFIVPVRETSFLNPELLQNSYYVKVEN